MAIGYRIHRDLGFTVSAWDGTITADDAHAHLECLAADPEWPPCRTALVDLTTVREVSVPDAGLPELLLAGTKLFEEVDVVVVLDPEMLYPTNEQYFRVPGTTQAMTFTDLDRACRYLQLNTATVEALIDEIREELNVAR